MSLYKYPNFEERLVTGFATIIHDYGFNVHDISSESFSGLELVNEHCIIRFTYDAGSVECVFIDPRDIKSARYSAFMVWSYLYPDDDNIFSKDERDFEKQINLWLFLLRGKLSAVLKGDFSWVEGFREKNEQFSKMIGFVRNSLSNDNPIRQKFVNGDSSWQKDLIQYCKVNNIKL